MKKTTKIETIHGQRIKCYDNGGATVDRYTVVFLDQPEPAKGHFACLGMNCEPFHPQGFGQHSSAMDGAHLGKLIRFEDLSPDCRELVLRDLYPEGERPAPRFVGEYPEPNPSPSPAPWEMSKDAVPDWHVQITIYDADGKRVATVFGTEANAGLIVRAPAMLALLEKCLTRNGVEGDRELRLEIEREIHEIKNP